MTSPRTSAQTALPSAPVLFLARLYGTLFFSGYAPIASGTVGSLVALGIYWIVPYSDNGVILILFAFTVLLTGIPVATLLERVHGDDPSIVVLDEAVGMWIAMAFLPKTLPVMVAAFLFFRLFDIVKPPPARQFDRMGGGSGIMLDDVIAGIYANIATWIILPLL